MRGDWVEILIHGSDGIAPYPFKVEATKAGRRVEVKTERGMVVVSEVTRHGDPVRESRFMASRVVALVEHKMESDEDASEKTPSLFPGGDQ